MRTDLSRQWSPDRARRRKRRGDEACPFRSARRGERLRAPLCEAAPAPEPDPTSIGSAPWHQRTGYSALGARRTRSHPRASRALARPLSEAPRLYARPRAGGSAPAVAVRRAAGVLRCLLDAGATGGTLRSPCSRGAETASSPDCRAEGQPGACAPFVAL